MRAESLSSRPEPGKPGRDPLEQEGVRQGLGQLARIEVTPVGW
jgi:hypothetical protein